MVVRERVKENNNPFMEETITLKVVVNIAIDRNFKKVEFEIDNKSLFIYLTGLRNGHRTPKKKKCVTHHKELRARRKNAEIANANNTTQQSQKTAFQNGGSGTFQQTLPFSPSLIPIQNLSTNAKQRFRYG
ncbi:unnamed protein product [Vicia faba]|uniref:RNase H type-1 domain-containing protein n=1 Tax=Vicia faba TaxID=3906 RepID=A0AAV0Z4E6_VICFA|nr:unnamed protein product [Vicia faba]